MTVPTSSPTVPRPDGTPTGTSPSSYVSDARAVPGWRSWRRSGAEDAGPITRIVSSRFDRGLMYLLILVMAVLWAFPLYAAVKKSLEVNGLGNYVSLFTDPVGGVSIPQTYFNTFVVGTIHAAVVLSVSLTAGYAFSKLRWSGRDLAFSAALAFLAIPGTALIVPMYRINNELGMFDSFLGVGLPEAAITIPFGVLIMRNFGRNIPDSLFEAAEIDGAGHLRLFWNVFLPLARPAVVNLAVLCYVWSLQDFLWPSIFLRDQSLTTAAQAVLRLDTSLGAAPSDIARYNASLVLLAVPAILVVLFGMRFIVSGLTSGASKE